MASRKESFSEVVGAAVGLYPDLFAGGDLRMVGRGTN